MEKWFFLIKTVAKKIHVSLREDHKFTKKKSISLPEVCAVSLCVGKQS